MVTSVAPSYPRRMPSFLEHSLRVHESFSVPSPDRFHQFIIEFCQLELALYIYADDGRRQGKKVLVKMLPRALPAPWFSCVFLRKWNQYNLHAISIFVVRLRTFCVFESSPLLFSCSIRDRTHVLLLRCTCTNHCISPCKR